MFNKKVIFFATLILLVSSCGDTWNSVKRGLTGQKENSSDEFLVKKKDPLVLPPNYDKLPVPDERGEIIEDEITSIKKTLQRNTTSESETSSSSSTEQSILKKIRTR